MKLKLEQIKKELRELYSLKDENFIHVNDAADYAENLQDASVSAETIVSPLTRYQKDVLQSAEENHIWINAMMCIRPTDEMKRNIGEQILQMLNNRENLILSNFDGTTFEELKQKELIIRINKS